jgi:uncharacterized membrane protein YozB (DUF420 family)
MTQYLPTINACLNAISAVLLVRAYILIRRKEVEQHRRTMLAAFCTSSLFLICYLVYHYSIGGSRPFGHEGTSLRTVYFAILITHTILAAAVPVLAIITLRRGLAARYDRHRRIARWTLPIWLYVSVTGVVVYMMLYHL